jgi:hypothetical protein
MGNGLWAGVVVLVTAAGAMGQTRPSTQPTRESQQARENEGSRLLRASKLPKNAEEVREKGVPDDEMRKALKAAKDKGVPAGEMAEVTAEQSRAIDDHGPTDNFGAFVQGKLDQGLRGRELSNAIRAEHAARGKGKGAIKSKKDKNKGQGGSKGGNADRGRPEVDRERDAKEREKAAREREAESRQKAEKAAKDARDAKEKAPRGNGKGKGK